MIIKKAHLVAIMPMSGPRTDIFLGPLNAAMAEFDIDTPARQSAFLAQIAHESAELSYLSENLNYSADGLANVWPHMFAATGADGSLLRYRTSGDYAPNENARMLHRHSEAIANFVYANRMGNGAVSSGDGWLYRGAGIIQVTGKDNQCACAAHFGKDPCSVGDWLRTPEGACRSAAWFWQSHGCNELADADDFVGVTKKINGGTNGLGSRRQYWAKAKAVLCPA